MLCLSGFQLYSRWVPLTASLFFFFYRLMCYSRLSLNGHLYKTDTSVKHSLSLTLYKTDTSLRRTLSAGPKGVRLRKS